MASVQAVTIDGTVIEADQFQSEKKGIKLKRKPSGNSGSSKPETIGFVPHEKLMYVIPEEVTHNVENLDELPA